MAIELLGDGGNVEFAEALIGDRTTFTFEFWIKPHFPPVPDAPNPLGNIVYSEDAEPEGVRNVFQILNEDPTIPGHELGALAVLAWPPIGSPELFSRPLTEGVWQHVAVVSDGGWLSVYVNGEFHDEGAAQGYRGAEPTTFRIGVSGDRVFGRFLIDEIRVSSTARYTRNFRPRVVLAADADTLSLWHFDEAVGDTTHDASGNHSDGVLSATVVRVVADR